MQKLSLSDVNLWLRCIGIQPEELLERYMTTETTDHSRISPSVGVCSSVSYHAPLAALPSSLLEITPSSSCHGLEAHTHTHTHTHSPSLSGSCVCQILGKVTSGCRFFTVTKRNRRKIHWLISAATQRDDWKQQRQRRWTVTWVRLTESHRKLTFTGADCASGQVSTGSDRPRGMRPVS